MTDRFLTPYAAKAIITHAFDTDHLNVWITFRFPMDQTVKPANALWICNVDGIDETVTASDWQDAFTMLLTVAGIASIPTVVTLAYDGPDVNLRITWAKQWEPWGPILSADSLPLPYGSFSGHEIDWTQVAAQDIWYPVLDPDITVNLTNKTTFQNNGELKILVNGIYTCTYSVSMESSIANKHVLTAFEVNGIAQTMGMNHAEYGRANEEFPVTAPGLFNLLVDDVIRVAINTPDPGNPTITICHINFITHEIGGTR